MDTLTMDGKAIPPDRSAPDFESELRIANKPIIAILAAVAAVLIVAINPRGTSSVQLEELCFAVLVQVALAIAWRLDNRCPWVSRSLTIILCVVMVLLGHNRWGVPGFLTLMVIPTILAAALMSLPAAKTTAVGETGLLLLLLKSGATGADVGAIATALIAIWATLGAMYAVYHPLQQVCGWMWDYFQHVKGALETARDRKMELEMALADLADANLQLTRLNLLAQGLRQEAEDARRTKEQFVANVSHELRTPLNMIIGFSEMMLGAPEAYGGKIPPAVLADLAVIHRNSQHLSTLVDDVLDLSQIEAEQVALSKEHVRLPEIVEDAAVAVRPLFDSKGLYLETEVPGDLPPVFCDRTRIREVLLNLLSNAGRFTEQGGVHLRVWQEGGDVIVSTADTGPGIAADDLAKLFEPFQQLAVTLRQRFRGSGLGLSISKRFIELHEGEIWVESEKGVGTTFYFRLPISPPPPKTGAASRWLRPDWDFKQRTHPSMAPKAVVGPRLILLEREASLERLLTRYLDGTEVVPVTSLEQALEELSHVPAQALLINDPSVSKTLDRLGASTTLPRGTPVIICSIPGVQEASAALGVAERLVKPVSQDTLLGALDRVEVSGGTVLIVDDEPDALHLFGRMLDRSGRGYRVLQARDGGEALSILHETLPDVILLDLIMPNMDGFRLLEVRNQDPSLREIPVIVISARDPAGQPVISSALAVTQHGGLSARQLLTSIDAISRLLPPVGQAGAPMPLAASSGQPACG